MSTRTPYYQVEIGFQRIAKTRWSGILNRLGSNADWVTHLVLGEMPPSIEQALEGANVKLLPRTQKEIQASCSCPDWVNPCKHIAGIYYHVASLLDRDPLLLFEFRGLERSKLLETVSKSEFGSALQGEAEAATPDLVTAARAARYPSVGQVASETPPSDLRAFWRGRPIPQDAVAGRQVPLVSALLLRREGDYPEFWHRRSVVLGDHGRYLRTSGQGASSEARLGPRNRLISLSRAHFQAGSESGVTAAHPLTVRIWSVFGGRSRSADPVA